MSKWVDAVEKGKNEPTEIFAWGISTPIESCAESHLSICQNRDRRLPRHSRNSFKPFRYYIERLQSESVAHTRADDTFVKLDRDVGNNSWSGCIGDGAIGGARSISKIDEEIFRLDAPISTQCDLDSRTDRPARLVHAAHSAVGEACADITKRGAGGAVDQKLIERVADAAARGAEPCVCRQTPSSTETRGGEGAKAAGIRPIAVGLHAEHQ
jgi:hypothetical protein